ncbi:hypothetical protein [Streptomyces sp. NPDC050121]|uniref:hypothetical protein n=1 Tax=Streptomyces sp. NPDC050121 TaxID=3365601 RepID=UPI0037BBC418
MNQQPTPLTDQQIDDIEAIAARVADDPFYVSDCEGSLQVWREKALTHVRRDESGEIDMYSFPSTYKVTDQIVELDLSTWDPGEDEIDDKQRQDIHDLVEARAVLPVLVAELRRLRARVTELEGPAVEARAALAALCYDLDDPGTAALGALYLLSQATVGVDAPRDDAAVALARHDAQVLRKAAETLEATDRDDDAINLLYLLADDVERPEETHVVADDSDDPEHVDDCPGCEAFTLTGHRAAAPAVSGAADSRPA